VAQTDSSATGNDRMRRSRRASEWEASRISIGKGLTWLADRDARSLEHFEVPAPQAVRCYHLEFRCPGEEMPAHLLCAASPEPHDESTIGLLLIRLAQMKLIGAGVLGHRWGETPDHVERLFEGEGDAPRWAERVLHWPGIVSCCSGQTAIEDKRGQAELPIDHEHGFKRGEKSDRQLGAREFGEYGSQGAEGAEQ
jgi:hypothetical protein